VQIYNKACSRLLPVVFCPKYIYTSFDDNQLICNTGHLAFIHSKLPVQAVSNGLKLTNVLTELSCLNGLEISMLSLQLFFMKHVALPFSKQICVDLH